MTNLTNSKFWSEMNRGKSKGKSHFEFGGILHKYLEPVVYGKVLEIGCVPGTYLAYISENFGYYPVGVDFDEKTEETTKKYLLMKGISDCRIIKEDFTKWETKEKFDLVTSFGFIEHFDNPKEIIKKHINLLKKGGKLIIEIPNLGGFNGFLHKLIDKPNLDKHNTKIMNLDFFKEVIEENNLKIIYLGYYGSWHFQWGYGRRQTANIFQKGIYAILKIISKFTRLFIMRNKLSNYIFLIAEKY